MNVNELLVELDYHPNQLTVLAAAELRRQYQEIDAVWMDAKRLALELECLIMSCDLPACSKWWDSANEALDLHRNLVKERQEQE